MASCGKSRPGSPTRSAWETGLASPLMPKSAERDPTRGGRRHHNRYRHKQRVEFGLMVELAAVTRARISQPRRPKVEDLGRLRAWLSPRREGPHVGCSLPGRDRETYYGALGAA